MMAAVKAKKMNLYFERSSWRSLHYRPIKRHDDMHKWHTAIGKKNIYCRVLAKAIESEYSRFYIDLRNGLEAAPFPRASTNVYGKLDEHEMPL